MTEKNTGADGLVMVATDHVATALRDMTCGDTMIYRIGEQATPLLLLDDIPFGHKVAIMNLAEGDLVKKYGETIGRATQHIKQGQHVHVHNVEGIRGRGDQVKKASEGS